MANKCSKLNSFTQKQIDKALERFKSWSGKNIKKRWNLDSLKIEIIEKMIYVGIIYFLENYSKKLTDIKSKKLINTCFKSIKIIKNSNMNQF